MRIHGIPRGGRLLVLAFAPALLLSAPAFLSAQGLSGADLEAQKGISDTFVRNVLARDWDAVAAMYAEDAILCPPNEPAVKGRAAIRAYFSNFPTVTAFTATDVRTDGQGDLAYSHGTFEITLTPPGAAAPIKDRGKYLDVRKKQKDGRWLYVMDFWSSDLPPPQGAK